MGGRSRSSLRGPRVCDPFPCMCLFTALSSVKCSEICLHKYNRCIPHFRGISEENGATPGAVVIREP